MASTVDAERVREYNEEDTPVFAKKVKKLAKMVRESKYTVFYTGAGVSTSAGVADYRGPSGAWTQRKIIELQSKSPRSKEEDEELKLLLAEQAKEIQKAAKKVSIEAAQPTLTHMAMATMIRLGVAHYVVTTNLDGIFRKAGLRAHEQLCCLHGDIYVERCTACGYDFERNYHVRQAWHVHDHKVGTCERCGSAPPKHYKGQPDGHKMKKSRWGGVMIGTRDKNCGTKDTHINFGEFLDEIDWNEADEHCSKADLCIIAGTSMSLRHITHFPFQAKKVVLINLQPTPDDDKADLRIWARCDPVFACLMDQLDLEIDPIPVWRPRDSIPLKKIAALVGPHDMKCAKELEEVALLREAEWKDRKKEEKKKEAAEKKAKKEEEKKRRQEEKAARKRDKGKEKEKEK
jgi:NAD-dependent SIR2 family protein deacetylase